MHTVNAIQTPQMIDTARQLEKLSGHTVLIEGDDNPDYAWAKMTNSSGRYVSVIFPVDWLSRPVAIYSELLRVLEQTN